MAVCEKRSLEETVHNAKNVLLDIEGTTTSISFVKDTLFPYVRKSLESYVTANWDKDEFKEVLKLLQEQAATDIESKVDGAVAIPSEGAVDEQQAAVVSNVLWQMDLDRKTTALKQLQGLVWRLGYKDGELKGHIYPDVAPALRRWTESGRKLYVYSSGSVEAQKLLFKYSQEGDLSELFSGHFDTTVGPKVEADSYKAIVKSLDCKPDNIVFLTDVPKEANAARQAGLPVVLVTREGCEELTADEKGEFSSVSTLEDVVFEGSATKKQKVEAESDSKEEVNGVGAKEEATEKPVEKMEVEEVPAKTEVAEEPKTDKDEKMEAEATEVASAATEKVSEDKASDETKKSEEKETAEKMEEDTESKEEKPKEEVVEKETPVEKKENATSDDAKPTEEPAKSTEESIKTESKEVSEESKTSPVTEVKDDKADKPEEKETKEEVKAVEKEKTAEVSSEEKSKEVEKTAEVKEDVKKVEKVEEAPAEKVEERTEEKAEVKADKTEEKTEKTEKSEDGTEEKAEEKTAEKVESVDKDKPVENKEEIGEKTIEKDTDVKETKEENKKEQVSEENVESKVPKQNGVENGEAVNGNGVSNGKSEENGLNGKEAHTDEVVVKKAGVAASADAEMAAEA